MRKLFAASLSLEEGARIRLPYKALVRKEGEEWRPRPATLSVLQIAAGFSATDYRLQEKWFKADLSMLSPVIGWRS